MLPSTLCNRPAAKPEPQERDDFVRLLVSRSNLKCPIHADWLNLCSPQFANDTSFSPSADHLALCGVSILVLTMSKRWDLIVIEI